MAKRKVKISNEEQANQDAAMADYNTQDTVEPQTNDQYTPDQEATDSLNSLIKTGKAHLNDIDMASFLKMNADEKKAFVNDWEKKRADTGSSFYQRVRSVNTAGDQGKGL